MPEICFITTCMGRLDHLRQTLPTVAAQGRASRVVVDYSCPQHCGDWVEQAFPTVRVVRVPDRTHFSISHARNAGAAAADAPWLCFSDADISLDPSFTAAVLPTLRPGYFYLPHPLRDEQCGTFLCSAADFARSGGYDEIIRGWGWEDVDLYDRLGMLGLVQGKIPSSLVGTILHEDDRRVEHYDDKDMLLTYTINRIYSFSKIDWMRMFGTVLDAPARANLYDDAARAVRRLAETGRETHLRLDFRKAPSWRLTPEITGSLVYTLRPVRDPDRPDPGGVES